jgi:hypothetical protein
MTVTTDTPRWRAYKASQTDGFGYDRERWGVREEYQDGATRYVHNQVFEDASEAETMAAKFNLNVRKGMTYDNVMKQWR